MSACGPASRTARRVRPASGIAELDVVLRGGLPAGRVHLVEGHPGTGKTTMGLCFMMLGAQAGERCFYVALSESEEELRDSARSHGWSMDGVEVMEVGADDPMRYRRQVMALRRHLQAVGATTLLLNDITQEREYDLQALVHGVLSLEMIERHYGAARRRAGRLARRRLAARQHDDAHWALGRGQVVTGAAFPGGRNPARPSRRMLFV